MIKILTPVFDDIAIAVSGGVDSMAVLDFLSRKRTRKIEVVYVDHGTETGKKQRAFVENAACSYGHSFKVFEIDPEIPKGASKEYVWSIRRHEVFSSLNKQVVLCHHLDDVIETWLISSMQGNPTIMQMHRENCVRPFLSTPKSEFVSWAERNNIRWVEDETNFDPEAAQRNFVRNVMMKDVLKVNPGIRKTIAKKVLETYK